MTITSTRPIVAERAMWWGGLPWTEGSVSIGSTATGTVWAIGEGAEGGPSAESTFVQVSNGDGQSGSLRFTVAYDDGTREQREYTLLGNARLTVRIADRLRECRGQEVQRAGRESDRRRADHRGVCALPVAGDVR